MSWFWNRLLDPQVAECPRNRINFTRLLVARLSGAGKKLRRIWVDGTYRGKLVDWVATQYQVLLRPVLRSDDMKGFVVLPRRWVVERTFAWLLGCRRLGVRYERRTDLLQGLLHLACALVCLRFLRSAP